jgi:HEAT repeat protein
MNRIPFLSSALLILASYHPPPAAADQDDEAARLKAQLVQARLENLDLKLRLARLAQKPAEELRILEEALASDLPDLPSAAFRELTAWPEARRREAIPAVLSRYPGAPAAFRIEAIAFLGRVADTRAEAAILEAARGRLPALRRAAALALKSAPGEPAQATLLVLLRDPDRDVRLGSLEALGVAKRDEAVKPILEALAEEREAAVQEKMVDALGAIGSPVAVADLLALLTRTGRDPIRWSCINSLGKIGDVRAAPTLRAFLNGDGPQDVRQVAIEALGKLKDAGALPQITDILKGDRDDKLRQSAAQAVALIGPPDAIETTLLPAYLGESQEGVRRALWEAILVVAGDRFAANEKLIVALLKADRRQEADQVCTRLHPSKPDPDGRARQAALEEAVGGAALQAGAWKAALPHLRRLAQLAPERTEVMRQIAACYRGLEDLETCLKTLGDLKDPEPLIEEASELLQSSPDEKRRAVELALRAGSLRLVEPLSAKDDQARKMALEAVLRQGRRILPFLAQELEENPRPSAAVLEAGSAITGIPNDPAPPNGLKARAAAWRAWLK